jgi:adenosine kinase
MLYIVEQFPNCTGQTTCKNSKIAVHAPIPKDHIITHHGEHIEKYGCATHTSIALSQLLGDRGTVFPVTHVRQKDEAAIKEIFAPYVNIDVSNMTSDQDQADVIYLKFLDQNKRVEKQTAFMNPILPVDIEHLMDMDVFVIAAVTDFEVPLQTLQYIKENCAARIVFDAHGPTNTLSINGNRHMKFWVDRDEWLPYIDVLKMNLEEANCSWYKKEFTLDEIDQNNEID